MRRLTKVTLGTVLGIAVLLVAGVALVLPRLNLAGFVAWRATEAIGRSVSIESIYVSVGQVLGVELRGARLDNIEGASDPVMATLVSVSGSVEWRPLLRGLVVIRRLEVDGLSLVLERNKEHQPNWVLRTKNPVARPEQAAPPIDRGGMPVIRDISIGRGQVVFRASTGSEFRARLDNATLSAGDHAQPVRLEARGSYNDLPLIIAATLGSPNALRNTAAPFPLHLRVASGNNTIDLRAAATDPLALNGVEGDITIVAPTPDTLLNVVDASGALDSPINFSAHVSRNGDVWRLEQAVGSLDGKPFYLPFVQFTEGHGGQLGTVTGELDVPALSGVVVGRQVALASLHISLNQSLRVELRGARMGNMPGGTDPTMVTLESLSAEIDTPSLMSGSIVVRRAEVDGLSLLLERSSQHGDNWNFAALHPTAPVPAVLPERRAQPAIAAEFFTVPVIHDLHIARGQIVFREVAGREHRVRLDSATIASADQLVRLEARGSYNDLPLNIAVKVGNSSALANAGAPFPLDLHVASGENTLDFRGAVTDARHADIEGQIALTVLAPAVLLDVAGIEGVPNLPVQLTGRVIRQGGDSRLDQASGAVDGNHFNLPLLQFVEGAAGRPHALRGELDVPRLTTKVLGRQVSFESLRASLDGSLRVELRGARLGNIPGGSEPDMLRVASLNAELEAEALTSGSVVVRSAEVDGLRLLLERDARRHANWHFGLGPRAVTPAHAPAQAREVAPPGDRGWVPIVHSLTIVGSDIVFRTSSGHPLITQIHNVTLTAPSADKPVTFRGKGSYNGVPLALDGVLGDLAALRDARIPFPMTLRAASGKTTLKFQGTATDPLNVDGMEGRLALDAPDADALLGIAGLEPGPQAAVQLAGTFTHVGDLWRLTRANGDLDGSPVKASLLQLIEGASGSPDAVIADLDIGRLDINRLLGRPGGRKRENADLPLAVDARPDPLVKVHLSVDDLTYAKLHATDARLRVEVAPGRIEVETLSLAAFDSRITASGVLNAAKRGTRIEAEVHLTDGNLETLRRAFGVRELPLAGPIEGHILASAEGRSLNEAVMDGHFTVVLAMVGGDIARKAIEIASLDSRALFRTARGTTPLACLLGVVDIRSGRGNASPLRIRAETGTISGLAYFDLHKKYLDLIIGGHRETTNFFALDVPVRVSGRFDKPNIAPAKWSRDGRARIANAKANVAALPPALRDFALRSPCHWGNRQ